MAAVHSIEGLIKWAHRGEWTGRLDECIEDHSLPAREYAGITLEKLPGIIGHGHMSSLWGCAFEDLLTVDFEDDGNIADDYLKRRGFRESPGNRDYIKALRGSQMSLYEVSGIVPEESFLVRDLLRGGNPVRVIEKSATRGLTQWDRVGARVLTVRGKTIISGAILKFRPQLGDVLEEAIAIHVENARRHARQEAKLLPGDADPADLHTYLTGKFPYADLAYLFTNVWLRDLLEKMLNPAIPEIKNSDGDALEFVTLRYPLLPGASAKEVRAALDALPDLRDAGKSAWNWLEAADAPRPEVTNTDGGKTLLTTLDSGETVLGDLAIKGRSLQFAANSMARAERGRAMLATALAGFAREPVLERQTMQDLLDVARRDGPAESSKPLPAVPETAETRAIVRREIDAHFARVLEKKIPMLGNESPRACAKTPAGRMKVVNWLKMLENAAAQEQQGTGIAGYDYTWMWKELGVAGERR